MSLFSATVLESVLNLHTHDRASAFNSDTQKPDQVWMRAIRVEPGFALMWTCLKYNVGCTVYMNIFIY